MALLRRDIFNLKNIYMYLTADNFTSKPYYVLY